MRVKRLKKRQIVDNFLKFTRRRTTLWPEKAAQKLEAHLNLVLPFEMSLQMKASASLDLLPPVPQALLLYSDPRSCF